MTKKIRTPTKASGGITNEERLAMADHSKLWISRAMRTKPVDVVEITTAIEGLYRVSGLKKPRVVVVPSPLVMAFAYGASAAIWFSRRTNSVATYSATDIATRIATDSATYSATDSATYSATRIATDSVTDSATRSATYSATRIATAIATDSATAIATDSATRSATDSATAIATDSATANATANATIVATRIATDSATDSATYHATRIATDNSLANITNRIKNDQQAVDACMKMAGSLGVRCAKEWVRVCQGGAYWCGYESYLTAMRDIIGLRLPEYEKYKFWERSAIAAPFRVMHEEFCIVSDFPEILKVDDENRPHCENGPSHRWRDGWELYHWHGVRVPDEWIRDKALTAEIAISWPNVEQRRAACEILGWINVLSALNAQVINKHENPQIGVLLEVELPDSGLERFLQVQCGTGRTFALPVPRNVKTALEAQAWTWGLSESEFKQPEVRT